jgi:hypothetical protein
MLSPPGVELKHNTVNGASRGVDSTVTIETAGLWPEMISRADTATRHKREHSHHGFLFSLHRPSHVLWVTRKISLVSEPLLSLGLSAETAGRSSRKTSGS